MPGLLSDLPRKNCWTIAEPAVDATPGGMQNLLCRAVWDTDAVRDDVREAAVERLGDTDAMLVVDETAAELSYLVRTREGLRGNSHRSPANLGRVASRKVRIKSVKSFVVNIRGGAAVLFESPGFFRVGQLVPDDQDVLTVKVGTKVGDALELMRENNFDQLPVTTTSGQVIGTFTYRSLAQGLRHLPARAEVLQAPVEDLVEELHFVRVSQDVSGILHHLEVDHAVLVGDEDRLLAVVTTADVSRFLWQRTRPFVLLRDIELAIRVLMRSCCTTEQLSGVMAACLQSKSDCTGVRLEDLTLTELLSVLLHGPSFGKYFRLGFGRSREMVNNTLSPVRDIRNKVFHFRDEVSDEDLRRLDAVAVWLRRKIMIRDGAR